MRLLPLLSVVFSLLAFSSYSQSPPGINYQGVARNIEGKPLVLKDISIKINIVQNGDNGVVEYAETHAVKTNSFGLFTLVIGTGSPVTGDFRFVSWAVGSKWLRVEMDSEGGNSFKVMGAQQFMSVPYAYYAQYASNSLKPGNGLSIDNNIITNTGDADNNPSNELNSSFELTPQRKLRLTDGGGTKEVDLSQLSTNQTLSGVLTLNNDAGNQSIKNLAAPVSAGDAATKAYVDSKVVVFPDDSPTNEIQALAYNSATKTLSVNPGGSSVVIPETQNLTQVLALSNNAGNQKITNLAAPTVATDAVTKKYVDDADNVLAARIATTYAFKTEFNYANSTPIATSNVTLPFTSENFDDFNVIAGSSFTAAEAGTYVFMVDGSYTAAIAGGQLSFLANGSKYPVAIMQPWGGLAGRYNSTMMFRLNAGQTVSLVGDNILVGGTFAGSFYGYKL